MPVVDAEGMDTGSNREEEDEQGMMSMMQLLNRNLLSFSPKTTAFTTKDRRSTKYKKRLLEILARELNTSGE